MTLGSRLSTQATNESCCFSTVCAESHKGPRPFVGSTNNRARTTRLIRPVGKQTLYNKWLLSPCEHDARPPNSVYCRRWQWNIPAPVSAAPGGRVWQITSAACCCLRAELYAAYAAIVRVLRELDRILRAREVVGAGGWRIGVVTVPPTRSALTICGDQKILSFTMQYCTVTKMAIC